MNNSNMVAKYFKKQNDVMYAGYVSELEPLSDPELFFAGATLTCLKDVFCNSLLPFGDMKPGCKRLPYLLHIEDMEIESFNFDQPCVKGDSFTQWFNLDHSLSMLTKKHGGSLGTNCAELHCPFQVSKKYNSSVTVLPNDMLMPIHTVHCEQKNNNNLASNFGHKIHTEHMTFPESGSTTEGISDASHTSCFTGKERNVIMDNFLTSLSLANKLIANKTSLL